MAGVSDNLQVVSSAQESEYESVDFNACHKSNSASSLLDLVDSELALRIGPGNGLSLGPEHNYEPVNNKPSIIGYSAIKKVPETNPNPNAALISSEREHTSMLNGHQPVENGTEPEKKLSKLLLPEESTYDVISDYQSCRVNGSVDGENGISGTEPCDESWHIYENVTFESESNDKPETGHSEKPEASPPAGSPSLEPAESRPDSLAECVNEAVVPNEEPESAVPKPASPAPNPESPVPIPDSPVEVPESAVPIPDSPVQISESPVFPEPEAPVLVPESPVQVPRNPIPSFTVNELTFETWTTADDEDVPTVEPEMEPEPNPAPMAASEPEKPAIDLHASVDVLSNQYSDHVEQTEDIVESTAEKKVKKKKNSLTETTCTTKTKKTKKTKKSEEKENISVITNGHSFHPASNHITSSSAFIPHDDDLSNICVKDLKQAYCSEANKSLTIKHEEPVPPSVPIKELRRSFGDLQKAFDAKETNILSPNNSESTCSIKLRARSLGDLRRINDSYKRPIIHTGISVKELVASYWNLVTNPKDKSTEPKIPTKFSPLKSGNKFISDIYVPRTNFVSPRNSLKPTVNVNNSVSSLKSSFSKFDQLTKKTVLHIRSSDATEAQNVIQARQNGEDANNKECKQCGKPVFVMEQIKAEGHVWHKNCFRCKTCNKQLTVDTYSSHEGELYCKPHFRELFKPKAVLEDDEPVRRRKPELIIRENQPIELPPDVVRASDKPDLGLEELSSLDVKSRFQIFEKSSVENDIDKSPSAVSVKRSPSILMTLAKFQAKGMNVGVTDESLNGIQYEESESESEETEESRSYRKPVADRLMSISKMEDVKKTWEDSNRAALMEKRREERKQERQHLRSHLLMGKQGKMKELYEQAVAESERNVGNGKRDELEVKSEKARLMRERFEKGEIIQDEEDETKSKGKEDDLSVFEAGICKKSRSLFLEMDANTVKTQLSQPLSLGSPQYNEPKKLVKPVSTSRQVSDDIVKCSDKVEDVVVETSDISSKFKFFETYKAPEVKRRTFRITPPRDDQQKAESPEKEIYRDPNVIRADDPVNEADKALMKSQTTSKMLSIFRQMEEAKESVPDGPKPKKEFTPPPDYRKEDSESDDEGEEEEEEEDEDEDEEESSGELVNGNIIRSSDQVQDEFLNQARNAAVRARALKEKFERWEPEKQSVNNAINLLDSDQASIEPTKNLRARFESLKAEQPQEKPRPRVNRFIPDAPQTLCNSCQKKVYQLEKIETDGKIFHKLCFRCTQCHCVLRIESYTFNNGYLYCLPHFKQLFISKGNYDEGFGSDPLQKKWAHSHNLTNSSSPPITVVNGSH